MTLMNISNPYIVFVILAVATGAVATTVAVVVAAKKNRKIQATQAPLNKTIDTLPYDPNVSEGVRNLTDSALRLWELERSSQSPASEIAELRDLLAKNDMYFFDPTGQYYAPAGFFEILSVQDGVDLEAKGTAIIVAESPAIVYKNTLIRKSKIRVYAK